MKIKQMVPCNSLRLVDLTLLGKREQCDIPGTFNGNSQFALVLCAISRNPTWNDLAPLAQKIPEHLGILVVDGNHLIGTKSAHLTALKELCLFHATPWLDIFKIML